MRKVADGGHGGPIISARAFLRELIAASDGFISFERFMRESLYHPQFGYYTCKIRTVGTGGDFSTTATLHGALAAAIARWVVNRRALLGSAARWHVIELGGGNGQMADDVLRHVGWRNRRKLTYHIVERSETLRSEQVARLSRWSQVRWHDEIDPALAASSGEALIISNEFVDAFPCIRLEWTGEGTWREVGVGWDEANARFMEATIPWTNGEPADDAITSSCFNGAYTATLVAGQRVEWHRDYGRWLRQWSTAWKGGAMLTVDYGDLLPALYHRRPAGTVRSYYRQTRFVGDEVYARPGEQDLTADVNFTDLARWGDALGMATVDLCTQAEFLRRWLPIRDAQKSQPDPAYDFITSEHGAGSAFKIMEQQKR